jgi:hypothetical protein
MWRMKKMSNKNPFKIINDDSDNIIVISAHKVSLKEAQDFVDGYVQLITLRNGTQVLMNEDGRDRNGNALTPNLAATAMLKPEGVCISRQGILGNVLILKDSYRWN